MFLWHIYNDEHLTVITLNGNEYVKVNREMDNYKANINLILNDIIQIGGEINDEANVFQIYQPIENEEE